MGKLLYVGSMNKWLNYFDDLPYNKSSVFKEGYDDPTYMTFKIEFGDWGASVLPDSALDLGITNFSAEKSDYDALPIGLLNCPKLNGGNIQHDYWQDGASDDARVFNNSTMYSAFKFLRSRNEDTRAKYLYTFVNGLLDIQRNTPYIFKKIQGLDTLETFDPTTGQRLKDAKIQLECYEGLNLKIRTLMELYRKAAWDDVYQRWILPENLREFKMIIYIFERRTFQTASPQGEGFYNFKYSDLNADLPVKAYECCPCEFEIKSSWKGDYSAAFEGDYENSTISIKVKNVKTYYKNGLLTDVVNNDFLHHSNSLTAKLDSIMIYDLVESVEKQSDIYSYNMPERTTSRIANTTINGVRALFLNKNILLENDEANYAINEYLHGYSLDGNNTTSIISNKYGTTTYKLLSQINDFNNGMLRDGQALLTYGDLTPRAEWIRILVNGDRYDFSRPFWQNISNGIYSVFNSAQRMILVSDGANLAAQQAWNNMLSYLYPPQQLYVSTACDGPLPYELMQVIPTYYHAERIRKIPFKQRNIPDQDMLDVNKGRNIEDSALDTLNGPRTITDIPFEVLKTPRKIKPVRFAVLRKRRFVPPQIMQEVDKGRMVDPQALQEVYTGRIVDEQTHFALDSDGRLIPEQPLKFVDDGRVVLPDTLLTYDAFRDIPEQEWQLLLSGRRLPMQLLYGLWYGRFVPMQRFKKLKPIRRRVNNNMEELPNIERQIDNKIKPIDYPTRELPEEVLNTISEPRKLTVEEFIELPEVARTIPEYKINALDLIDTISKATIKPTDDFLQLDSEYKDIESAAIDLIKNNATIISLDKIQLPDKKKQEILDFAKVFAENSAKVREAYISNIKSKKQILYSLTDVAVRELPDVDLYELDPTELETKVKQQKMLSLTDMEQIANNVKLFALDDAHIREMSFNALMSLTELYDKHIDDTQNLLGLSDAVLKTSKAANKYKNKNYPTNK